MEPLDLKEFIWQSRETLENFIILTVTKHQDENVVVYREVKDRSRICIMAVSDFYDKFEATYHL